MFTIRYGDCKIQKRKRVKLIRRPVRLLDIIAYISENNIPFSRSLLPPKKENGKASKQKEV
jgi:hypothetical protein